MKVFVLLLAAALMMVVPASSQDFVIKIASPVGGDASTAWAMEFKRRVEARTGGRIKVGHYPNGQLGDIPATVEGISVGTIEMAIVPPGFLVGLEPRFQVLDIPGLLTVCNTGRECSVTWVCRRL